MNKATSHESGFKGRQTWAALPCTEEAGGALGVRAARLAVVDSAYDYARYSCPKIDIFLGKHETALSVCGRVVSRSLRIPYWSTAPELLGQQLFGPTFVCIVLLHYSHMLISQEIISCTHTVGVFAFPQLSSRFRVMSISVESSRQVTPSQAVTCASSETEPCPLLLSAALKTVLLRIL